MTTGFEAFMEKMNALLASGEVPGLFEGEELNQLLPGVAAPVEVADPRELAATERSPRAASPRHRDRKRKRNQHQRRKGRHAAAGSKTTAMSFVKRTSSADSSTPKRS